MAEPRYELSGLWLNPLEGAAPEKAFRTHDVEDKGPFTVKPIENAAGWFDDLAIACARTKLFGAASALRVLYQLPDMLDDPLNQGTCGGQVLKSDVICDRFQISDGGLGPDYLSHLERRFPA